ncbi:hypothetical protein ACS127_16235 [Amphibacillus sp. Q70]|uniref:hypothetical protein n=1 Tax=Amphibacillus sp. Q70 TaxID=3453416 RepID=UPI003F859C14
MIVNAILSVILDGALQGPLTNPIVLVGVFMTNMIWGVVLGGMASMVFYRNKEVK